ncbi:MAG: HAD-IA family hydrolase [Candidatus Liptonbacteria bacterium]|nr:HAD-IA family hydrolase [Candidatus Liptonbacteria bacterium]
MIQGLPAPRVIICDMGNVLVNVTPPDQTAFFAKCAVSAEEIKRFFTADEEFFEYERGHTPRERFFEIVQEKLGYRGDFRQWVDDFCDIFSLNREVYDLLLGDVKINNQVEIWLLSNLNELHYEFLLKRWPGVFSSCRRVFLSFELGMRKPEPAIWELILRTEGAKRERCLLIDDLEANCRGAFDAGMSSVMFLGILKLREQLEKFGLNLENREE